MKILKPILSYVHPVYFYYILIYFVSLILNPIFGVESIWQICWDKFRNFLGDDIKLYTVWFINVYFVTIHWIFGFAIIAMEKLEFPKSLRNYKISKKPSEIEEGDNYYKVIRIVLRNQLLALLVSLILYEFDKNSFRMKFTPELPSFFITMRDLIISFLIQETLFYYLHRSLHHRKLFWLHKKHHEFTIPVAITTQYCGVVEYFLCNIFPITVGPKILGSHFCTVLLFWTNIVITSMIDHSGYDLISFHSAGHHLYHHVKYIFAKMQILKPILSYVHPMYYYYIIIYCISLFLNPILGVESIWQVLWDKFRNFLGDDIEIYTIWFINLYTIALYWIFGFAIIAMEKLEMPKNFRNYQIRKKPSEIEEGGNYYKVIRVVSKNQLFAFAASVILSKFDKNSLGIKITPELPTFTIAMRDLTVSFFLLETIFYFLHRSLHHRNLYWLHKKHHEFTSPASITAAYCGVFEHFLCNIFPITIGPKILGSHFCIVILYWTNVIITTLIEHSGYNLVYFHSPEVHLHHHTKFNVNYAGKLWSQLSGTYYEEIDPKQRKN